jgi:hypothetical protein
MLLIPPCNYFFLVNSIQGFFELVDIITSVSISSTIGLAKRLVVMDLLFIQLVLSILTVESRYDTFFRHIKRKLPNPALFDTSISNI